MATTAPADLGRESGDDPRKLEGAPGKGDASGARERSSGVRGALRLLVVGLLMAALGYGGGRLHAWTRAEADERQREAELVGQQAEELRAREEQQQTLARTQALTDRALRERDQLAVVAGLYEGYRRVQHALNALDARNFGIAEARVRDAERQLAPLAGEVAGLPSILEQLAGTSVAVAGNLSDQRRALATIATALDGALTEQRTAANIEELQAATRKDDPAQAKEVTPGAQPAPQSAPAALVPARPEGLPAAPTADAPRADEGGDSAR